MFSIHSSSLQLVSLLKQSGISHVVVCPGSRNAPIVHDMAEAGLTLHEVTDERSAGFFALGLIEALSTPVAICVTSGSALLNVAPAVAEGYYQQLPLLVVSADRPAAWIGQMDGQTLPQPDAFGALSVCSVTLPQGEDEEIRWHRNRLINEALLRLQRHRRPVHINVPLSEPLFHFQTTQLPDERLIHFTHYLSLADLLSDDDLSQEWCQAQRKLIVVGQMDPSVSQGLFTAQHTEQLARAGIVVLFEQLSNLQCQIGAGRHSCLSTHDAILAHIDGKELDSMRPDMLITLGGHVVSKRLKHFLRHNPPVQHWHITDSIDQLPDLSQHVTRFVEAPLRDVFLYIISKNLPVQSDSKFVETWTTRHQQQLSQLDTRHPLASLASQLPPHWHIQVANSSMVRHLQLVAPNLRNVVRCNRGVNGIEGSLSAAVGYRAAGIPTLVLIGDLSFFYDQNALWNASLHDSSIVAPLRILLINNGGGAIFQQLPGLEASPYRDRYVSASHTTTAAGIAQQSGIDYHLATSSEQLNLLIPHLFSRTSQSILIEYLNL